MTIIQVALRGQSRPLNNPDGRSCWAAVFRTDYRRCTNRAVKQRDAYELCAPHSRLDELEVVKPDALTTA